MASWTDYLKYTNPLTAGTAVLGDIGSNLYDNAQSGNLNRLGTATANPSAIDIGAPVRWAGDTLKSPGYDTAAEGAKAAQAYLQQLSQTAWDRQMQGLQGALGSFAGYDALTAQMNPRHGGQAGGGQGAGGTGGAGAGPTTYNPALPPPGTVPTTGYRPPLGAPRTPLDPSPALPPPGTPSTGYSPPPGAPRMPLSPPPALPPPQSYAPPSLPPPGAAPALPPPGGGFAPALPPPGSPIGAPPSLAPPGIMDLLAQMTTARSGRGSF